MLFIASVLINTNPSGNTNKPRTARANERWCGSKATSIKESSCLYDWWKGLTGLAADHSPLASLSHLHFRAPPGLDGPPTRSSAQ